MTDSGYAQWTLKELRSACEEGFDAYLDFIETRKKERLDSFIRQTAGKRGGPGFHLGDVVRAFMSFLPAALAELGEEGQAEFGKALYEPVEYAVATLADTYLQAKENEMFTTIRRLGNCRQWPTQCSKAAPGSRTTSMATWPCWTRAGGR
jgi:hypothetical protein